MKTGCLRFAALILTCSALALGSSTSAMAAAGCSKEKDAKPLLGDAAVKSTALPQAKGEAKATPHGKPFSPDISNQRQPDQKLGCKGGADELPVIQPVVMPTKASGPQGDTYASI